MGSALAERLVDAGHELSVWNRTAGRTDWLRQRGVSVMASLDDLQAGTDAVFLCLADDASTLEVAGPGGEPRSGWSGAIVVNTGTVSPGTETTLEHHYGDRFLAASIIGAPAAVRSGSATFILGGANSASAALSPIWDRFARVVDAGEDPAQAAIIKVLHNQMLLVALAMLGETVRMARSAGVEDEFLTTMLRDSPVVPTALQNRLDGLFDPEHAGWFTSPLAAKDLALAIELTDTTSPLPVTEAARDVYLRIAQDGWDTVDITAVVEYGRLRPTT